MMDGGPGAACSMIDPQDVYLDNEYQFLTKFKTDTVRTWLLSQCVQQTKRTWSTFDGLPIYSLSRVPYTGDKTRMDLPAHLSRVGRIPQWHAESDLSTISLGTLQGSACEPWWCRSDPSTRPLGGLHGSACEPKRYSDDTNTISRPNSSNDLV